MSKITTFLTFAISLSLFAAASCAGEETESLTFNPDSGATTEPDDPNTEPDDPTVEPGDALPIHVQTPHNSDSFEIMEQFSEDFGADGATTYDTTKWEAYDDNSFAAWTFVKENVTIDSDKGNNPESGDEMLCVTAEYDPHNRSNSTFDFDFKSGILRSKEPVNYGYYEARLKGSNVWPGTCSAFWLYSIVDKDAILPRAEGTIVYNEIDIVEIQQVASDQRTMACNIHLMYLADSGSVDSNGGTVFTNTWAKASSMPTLAQNQFNVEWYADDDYHIYACENRPDSIVFYIDNQRVGGKANYYWHMEEGMYITFSLGMRTPFEQYIDGVRQPKAPTTQEEIDQFPTSMYVDYIKSYTRDYSDFRNNSKAFSPNDIY